MLAKDTYKYFEENPHGMEYLRDKATSLFNPLEAMIKRDIAN